MMEYLKAYAQIAMFSALFMAYQVGRPRNAGQVLSVIVCGLAWPFFLAYAAYHAVRKVFAK